MKRFWEYFLRNEMPIWLSIVLALAAGIGAYFLAPVINQDIEYENNRVEHVSSTVNSINQRVVDLSKGVRHFNRSLFYGDEKLPESREVVLDQITELQWNLIDVSTILDREQGGSTSVDELKFHLNALYEAVQNASEPEDQEKVIVEARLVAEFSQAMLDDLYYAARLK